MDLSPNLVKPGTMNQIREGTVKDLSLMTLKKAVVVGWPSQKSKVPNKIRAYWDFRETKYFMKSSVQNGTGIFVTEIQYLQ